MACGDKCLSCSVAGGCDECPLGFTSAGDRCWACGDHCNACEEAHTCLVGNCTPGYGLVNDRCVKCTVEGCNECDGHADSCTRCEAGSGVTRAGDCAPCEAHCAECSALGCERCARGYGRNGGRCLPCADHCLACSVAGQCERCADGFTAHQGQCAACPAHCAECSAEGCRRCQPRFMLRDGICEVRPWRPAVELAANYSAAGVWHV